MRQFSLSTGRALAVAYPFVLALLIACLRLIGERWWGTTVALYLPRWPLALPLVPLTVFIVWCGPRSLLWTQLAAAGLLCWPLLGFQLSLHDTPTSGGLRLRVVSCNVDAGAAGNDSIVQMLRSMGADIIVLQAVIPAQYEALRAGLPGYNIKEAGQFWIASRFPVSQVFEPPRTAHRGFERSKRFVRFTVETPSGPVLLYDVHPTSPRDGFEEIRKLGMRSDLLRGGLLDTASHAAVAANTQLRLAQVRAIAEDSLRSPYPVLIAGDTNLPGLSWAFAHLLGQYQDGFAAAGNGFGYTFPAPSRAWLRIDRVLANAHWRFLDFQVIPAPVSDHFAVFADLQLKGGG